MLLASDLNNGAFSGAQNPDRVLHVSFFWHQPEGPAKEVADAHGPSLPKVAYIRIVTPGDQTSVIETAVREDHKARWPREWLAWQISEGLIGAAQEDVPGWKLKDWPVLNEGQLRELEFLRFSTVEQVAGASDTQIQRLGMGGIGLREQARAALKERARAEVRAEVAEQEKMIAEMRARDEQREKEMAQLREMIQLMQTAPKEPAKRRGRPPKEPQAA